jgi:hypothetical protein
MIELEACMATQSWVNREYRRGLSTDPCWAPVLSISVVEVFLTFTIWRVAHQDVQDPVVQDGFQTQDPSLMISSKGTMVLKAELSSMNSILT